jgi:pyridinium-3,5-biscarboxylic acid mononucleotide sulfurtransferase
VPASDDRTAGLLAQLRAAFAARRGVAVGFSGGVDSAVLAKVAHDALGPRALAITVVSPSLARRELDDARALAGQLGLRWRAVEGRELDDPRYVANPTNRCFFCREEMSAVLARVAGEEGIEAIAMGVHTDDLAEDRPGHAAMRAAGVWFPLLEVGAGKADVRAMAHAVELAVADKPAAACLSSRVQHGDAITPAKLARIEAAEDWLLARGFRVARVRVAGLDARVEVGAEELARLQAMEPEVVDALRALGFARVEIDPRGYRAGGARPAPTNVRLRPA